MKFSTAVFAIIVIAQTNVSKFMKSENFAAKCLNESIIYHVGTL